jgi:hypothetical protein
MFKACLPSVWRACSPHVGSGMNLTTLVVTIFACMRSSATKRWKSFVVAQ